MQCLKSPWLITRSLIADFFYQHPIHNKPSDWSKKLWRQPKLKDSTLAMFVEVKAICYKVAHTRTVLRNPTQKLLLIMQTYRATCIGSSWLLLECKRATDQTLHIFLERLIVQNSVGEGHNIIVGCLKQGTITSLKKIVETWQEKCSHNVDVIKWK